MKAYFAQIWRMHFLPWLHHNHFMSKVQKSAIKHIHFVLQTHNNLTVTENTNTVESMKVIARTCIQVTSFNYLLKYSASHDSCATVPDDGKLHLTELWKVSGVNLQSCKGENTNLRGNSVSSLPKQGEMVQSSSFGACAFQWQFCEFVECTSLSSISEKTSLVQLSPTLSAKIKKPNRLPAAPFHTPCQYPFPLVIASSSLK